ncbi:MAG: LLM class flavin-dependent oxidoreductase [Nakamurella sp.]
MTVSVLFGQQIDSLDVLVDYARFCEQRELRLWTGQSLMLEPHAALAAVAGRGVSVDVGLSVGVAPLRTPFDAMTQARTVAALMGRPVSAGYGMGTLSMAQALLGRPLTAPARYTADYLHQLRALREPDALPADQRPALRLYPLAAPAVEIGCGVLRPRMAKLAGGVADFVVTWLTPLDHLTGTLLPELDNGAADAGRKRPRVVSIVQCAVARADRNPVRLASLGCGMHLTQPHYAGMLRQAGVDVTGDRAGDLRAAIRSGLFVYGSAEQIADTVIEYHRKGVDEVVLNTASVGLEHGSSAALDDIEQVLEAVERKSPPE